MVPRKIVFAFSLSLMAMLVISGCVSDTPGDGQDPGPSEDPCKDVRCPDSTKVCPDGAEVRCGNTCGPITGKCSTCVPECSGHEDPCGRVNCDDGNPCTEGSCSAGECHYENVENGTACGQGGYCEFGTCVNGSSGGNGYGDGDGDGNGDQPPQNGGLQPQLYCSDSESPEGVLAEKGVVQSHLGTFEDYCFDRVTLYEFRCKSAITIDAFFIQPCVCTDGTCEMKAYDSSEYEETDLYYDNETRQWVYVNIYEKGTATTPDFTITDYCVNDFTLRETQCYQQSGGCAYGFSTIFCPGNCVDGACVKVDDASCSDPDGGLNFYEKSTLQSNYATFTDSCENEVILLEGMCFGGRGGDDYEFGKSYAKFLRFPCPNGCSDGTCIP